MKFLSRALLISSVFFFCLPGKSLYSQDYVKWGPSYKIKGNSEAYKFLGILGDRYYYVMKPNETNIIQAFNMKHELVSSEKFNYVRNRDRLRIHGGVETSAGSYLYMHQLSRKYKEWIIHVSEIKNGKIQEPREAYFQELDIENNRLNKAIREYEFDFGPVESELLISEDSSKVAFVNIIPANDFRDDDLIALAVFDSTMTLEWKDVFYYRFGQRRYEIEQRVLSNSGEVYLVGRVDKDNSMDGEIKTIKEKNLPRYDYYLYHINQEGILPWKIDLGFGNAPTDVALFFPERGTDRFLMAGFYTDDEHRNRIKGIFFSYGDKNFTDTDIRKHSFSEEFLEGLISERAIEKGKGLEETYKIMDVLNYRDGSIGFIAENNYVRDLSQTDIYGRWFRRIVYVSDEIIIPKFSKEGDLISIQKIGKDFTSEIPQYTSYAMALNNGMTYILFNDYKSGRERKEIAKKGNRFTDMVILDQNGRIIGAQNLFTDREIEFEFNPDLCDYNGEFFLIGSKRGNRFSMATLQFVQ